MARRSGRALALECVDRLRLLAGCERQSRDGRNGLEERPGRALGIQASAVHVRQPGHLDVLLRRQLDYQLGKACTSLAAVQLCCHPEGAHVAGFHISWHDRTRICRGRIAREDQTTAGSRGCDALKRQETSEIATLGADVLEKDLNDTGPGCRSCAPEGRTQLRSNTVGGRRRGHLVEPTRYFRLGDGALSCCFCRGDCCRC